MDGTLWPVKPPKIILADHGMAAREGDPIDLDKFASLADFKTVNSLLYPSDESAAATAEQQLKSASNKFRVYRRRDLPVRFHLYGNPRTGDPVVIATGPYIIRAHPPEDTGKPQALNKGEHGYDPYEMKSMRAIFYAVGPDIRPGYKLAPFENTNIYPLIAKILGLRIGRVDGHIEVLQGMLKPSGNSSDAVDPVKTTHSGKQSTSSAPR